MHALAELAKALSAYLNITRRTAWAILVGAVAFVIVMSANIFWIIPIWTVVVAPVIGFVGMIVAYRPDEWQTWRRRRKQQKLGAGALDHLSRFEESCVLFIYHTGGSLRSGPNRFIAELERLHILTESDPLGGAHNRIYRLTKPVEKALYKRAGRPDARKAGGRGPWEIA